MTEPDVAALRCCWITDPDADKGGYDPQVLIPGCSSRIQDPTAECTCDTLAWRLHLHIEQRKELESVIGEARRRLRAWSKAADVAWPALTGKETRGGCLHPTDIERAARAHTCPTIAADSRTPERSDT